MGSTQTKLAGQAPGNDWRHNELWKQSQPNRLNIRSINWAKAHATLEKAKELGFTTGEWYGNKQADELATEGTKLHHDEARKLESSITKNGCRNTEVPP